MLRVPMCPDLCSYHSHITKLLRTTLSNTLTQRILYLAYSGILRVPDLYFLSVFFFFYISEFVKIRYTGRLYPLVNTFLTDTDVLLANSFILSPVLDIVPLNFWNAFFSGPSPSSASVSLSTVSSLLPLYFWFLETSCVSVLVPSPTLFPL